MTPTPLTLPRTPGMRVPGTPDAPCEVTNRGQFWCPDTEGLDPSYRQDLVRLSERFERKAFGKDCIPRANFDTFLWALVGTHMSHSGCEVTIFQIMTGRSI